MKQHSKYIFMTLITLASCITTTAAMERSNSKSRMQKRLAIAQKMLSSLERKNFTSLGFLFDIFCDNPAKHIVINTKKNHTLFHEFMAHNYRNNYSNRDINAYKEKVECIINISADKNFWNTGTPIPFLVKTNTNGENFLHIAARNKDNLDTITLNMLVTILRKDNLLELMLNTASIDGTTPVDLAQEYENNHFLRAVDLAEMSSEAIPFAQVWYKIRQLEQRKAIAIFLLQQKKEFQKTQNPVNQTLLSAYLQRQGLLQRKPRLKRTKTHRRITIPSRQERQ